MSIRWPSTKPLSWRLLPVRPAVVIAAALGATVAPAAVAVAGNEPTINAVIIVISPIT